MPTIVASWPDPELRARLDTLIKRWADVRLQVEARASELRCAEPPRDDTPEVAVSRTLARCIRDLHATIAEGARDPERETILAALERAGLGLRPGDRLETLHSSVAVSDEAP